MKSKFLALPPAHASHWAEWDHIQKKGRTVAACGACVERHALSLDPTCPACHRLAHASGDEMFGAPEAVAR